MLAEQVALYLDGLGLVDYRPTSTGGDCAVQHMPPEPDEWVGVFASGGLDPGPVVKQPTFQIRTRGNRAGDSVTPHDRLVQIAAALHGFRGPLPDGSFLLSCFARQAHPVALGADEHGRHEFTLNFVCTTRTEPVPA